MKKLLLTCLLFSFASSAQAAIVFYDLAGTAGPGLLPGNEPGTILGGTGGEIGGGIFLDTDTNILTLGVGWGSSQGFTDLSNTASASHIHGPVSSDFGAGFTQTFGTAFNLARSTNAVTGGVFTPNTVTLSPAQVTALDQGKFYINIHTTGVNSGGELRGFIVPVPEPTSAVLGLASLGALTLRRRRA